ncbi:hypothetical protein ABC733_14665 [Mangrovibacter sp. SLW1]
MNKELELDNLIMNYFGRDYDLIDGSDEIRPKIDAYLRQSGKGMQARLLEDIRFSLPGLTVRSCVQNSLWRVLLA